MLPATLVALAPALTVLAWWEAAWRALGLLPEPAPPTPPTALILTGPDGARIALYPASALGGAR